MSSEKRLIAWKTLERDVPPLKTHAVPSWGVAKMRPSNQHTQKSFSTMNSGRLVRFAQLRQ